MAAFKRIYHDDDMAQADWSLIVHRKAHPRPIVTEDTTEKTKLENEYLEQTFERNAYYATPERTERIDEEGQQVFDEGLQFSGVA